VLPLIHFGGCCTTRITLSKMLIVSAPSCVQNQASCEAPVAAASVTNTGSFARLHHHLLDVGNLGFEVGQHAAAMQLCLVGEKGAPTQKCLAHWSLHLTIVLLPAGTASMRHWFPQGLRPLACELMVARFCLGVFVPVRGRWRVPFPTIELVWMRLPDRRMRNDAQSRNALRNRRR
jgi:hypothetical protein